MRLWKSGRLSVYTRYSHSCDCVLAYDLYFFPVNATITAITSPFRVALPNNAWMTCVAFGFPQPVITWLTPVSADPIQPGTSTEGIKVTDTPTLSLGNHPAVNSTLTISSSKRVHNGTYTCVAMSMSTPATTATATTDLTVLGKHWHGNLCHQIITLYAFVCVNVGRDMCICGLYS